MRSTGKTEWEKYVHFICDNINNCSLDAIGGMSPASINEYTEYKVRMYQEQKKAPFLDWHRQEENIKSFAGKNYSKSQIKLGDFVYKVFPEEALGKSYDTQRGRLYIVKRILSAKDPLRYELSGLKGNPIPGTYYAEQLTVTPEKPDKDKYWLIREEDNRKERTFKGKKQVFVHFLYYPANEGEWINKKDIKSASIINEPPTNL